MTTLAGCPDPTLLSQLLDHELEAEEERTIRRHMESCLECQKYTAKLIRGKEMVHKAFPRMPQLSVLDTFPQRCVFPEHIAAYVQRVLPAAEQETVERHLQICNRCLGEVMEAFRVTSVVQTLQTAPVPEAVQVQVASQWERALTLKAKQTVSLSRLVVQITQKGMRMLEQHLIEPLLEVQETFMPAPVSRAGEAPEPLDLHIKTNQAEIHTLIIQEGTGVTLNLTFCDSSQETLTGQRVFLRQHGRSIFSARTDKDGVLRTPHLEPGVYEVSCPGMNTTFQLELRS